MMYNFRQIQRSWTLHDELPGLLKISFQAQMAIPVFGFQNADWDK